MGSERRGLQDRLDKAVIAKEYLTALTEKVDIDKAYNTSFWDAVPKADKEVA